MGPRILRRVLRDGGQRSRQIILIGIEPPHQVAGGHAEPFVEGVGLALIGLRHPAQVWIARQHLERMIARAAVDHDVFEIRVPLPEHAKHGVFQIIPIVETGSDNRDFRNLPHSLSRENFKFCAPPLECDRPRPADRTRPCAGAIWIPRATRRWRARPVWPPSSSRTAAAKSRPAFWNTGDAR